MTLVSEDIKDMLVAGLGYVFGTNLFISQEPSSPSNCITIFDTSSSPHDLGLTATGYRYDSIQIRVRNKDYTTGMGIAEDIIGSLHGRAQETWNETLYTVIICSSGPAMLDKDDNSRSRIVVNFNLQRR